MNNCFEFFASVGVGGFESGSSSSEIVLQSVGWALIHFLWQGSLLAALAWMSMKSMAAASANARYVTLCVFMLMMLGCPVATTFLCHANTVGVNEDPALSKATTSPKSKPDFSLKQGDNDSSSNPGVNPNGTVGIEPFPIWPGSSSSETEIGGVSKEVLSVESFEVKTESAKRFAENDFSDDKTGHASIWGSVKDRIDLWAPSVGIVWAIGVVLLSLRLLVQLRRSLSFKKSGTQAATQPVLVLLEQTCSAMNIRQRVEAKFSSLVDCPTLLGWFQPMLLLPAASVSGLSTDQLRAIIAHELAHVRRADYAINLFQSIAETILFYHPAVWWLSNQIRIERENCCDDLAAKTCRSPKQYAEALFQLEKARAEWDSVAPLGMRSDGASLVDRIQRLVGKKVSYRYSRSWIAGAVTLTLVSFFMMFAFSKSIAVASVDSAVAGPSNQSIVGADSKSKEAADSTVMSSESSTSIQEQEQKKLPTKLVITVNDENGKPIPGSRIHKSHVWKPKGARTPIVDNTDYIADENGQVTIDLHPGEDDTLRLWARHDGYAGLFHSWETEQIKSGTSIPAEFPFNLVKGKTAGGFVKNEKGEPIVGAKVAVYCNAKPPGATGTRFNSWLAEGSGRAETDENGYWEINNVPPVESPKFRLTLTHPDYIDDARRGQYQAEQGIVDDDILAKTATIQMVRGISITGLITDENGDAVSNGLVVWGDGPYFAEGSQETRIDAEGKYSIPPQKPGKLRLTVVVPNWKPVTKVVDIGSMSNQFDFQLEKGNSLILKFVDSDGKPVQPVSVSLGRWDGVNSLYNTVHPNVKPTQIPVWTDAGGIYRWNWAPDGEILLNIYGYGFAPVENYKIEADGELHVVKLQKFSLVRGKVVDRATGEAVRNVKVSPVEDHGATRLHVSRRETIKSRRGNFDMKLTRSDVAYRILVEADGYRAYITDRLDSKNENPLKIELEAAPALTGQVIDETGKPVANLKVKMVGKNVPLGISNLRDNPMGGRVSCVTDKEGRFKFIAPYEAYQLYALSDAGSVRFVSEGRDDQPGVLHFQSYASVTGNLKIEEKPAVGKTVYLSDLDRDLTAANLDFRTTVEKDGRFSFLNVPPGRYRVSTNTWSDRDLKSDVSIPIELVAGKTLLVDLSDEGIPVRGKLVGQESKLGMGPMSARYVIELDAPHLSSATKGIVENWSPFLATTIEGLKEIVNFRVHKIQIDKDGSFAIRLPAGRYALQVNQWEIEQFEVTAEDIAAGEKKLGTRKFPQKRFEVGDTLPDIEFVLDGAPKRLSDLKGKAIVLGLVSGDTRFSESAIDRFVAKSKKEKRDVHFVLLNVGGNKSQIESIVKKLKIDATVGQLADWSDTKIIKDLRIGFVPTLYELDGNRKIVPEGSSKTSKEPSNAEEKPSSASSNVKKRAVDDSILVTVLDDKGNPLPKAHVGKTNVRLHTGDEQLTVDNASHNLNEKGQVRIPINSDAEHKSFRLTATCEGYAGQLKSWSLYQVNASETIPQEFVFRLQKGRKAGGYVRNEEGRPIANVQVQVVCRAGEIKDGVHYLNQLTDELTSPKTNDDGCWEINNAPPVDIANFSVSLTHPDFIEQNNLKSLGGDIPCSEYFHKKAIHKMQKGVRVSGTIRDANGNPVKNGLVILGDDPFFTSGSQEVRINADGTFETPPLPMGKTRMTVVASGWAPSDRIIDVSSMSNSQDFQLESGHALAIKFIDAGGKPISDVRVGIQSWHEANALYNGNHPSRKPTGIPFLSDGGGIYRWNWAPIGPIVFSASKPGYQTINDIKLEPDGTTSVYTLTALPNITGTIKDRKTGKHVDGFRVNPVQMMDGKIAMINRLDSATGEDGNFELKLKSSRNEQQLLIEAKGYRSFLTNEVWKDRDDVAVVLTPAPPVVGHVLDSEGKASGSVRVVLVPKESTFLIRDLDFSNAWSSFEMAKVENGEFDFLAPHANYLIFAASENGFAVFESSSPDDQPGELRLEPYARIDGQIIGGSGIQVDLLSSEKTNGRFRFSSVCDENGRFSFEKVPPGEFRIETHTTKPLRENELIKLDPGQRISLVLDATK